MKALMLFIGLIVACMNTFAQVSVEKVDNRPMAQVCAYGDFADLQNEAKAALASIQSFKNPKHIFHLYNDPEQLKVWNEIQAEELPARIARSQRLIANHPELQEVIDVWQTLKQNRLLGLTLNQAEELQIYFADDGNGASYRTGTLTIDVQVSSLLGLREILPDKDYKQYLISLLSHELSHILVDWHNMEKYGDRYIEVTLSDETQHIIVDLVAMKLTGQSLENFHYSFAQLLNYYSHINESSGDISTRLNCFSQWLKP